jgi:hypothetical protein
MPLTRRQKSKVKELEEISKIAHVDFWNVKDSSDDDDVKDIVLDLAKNRLIRADIIFSYVLTDQLLSELIARHFFDPQKTVRELWETPKFKHFSYHVLEGMSLLRKLALVKEFWQIPKPIEDIITRMNVIRNAIAHVFFPMDKKDFIKIGTVTYKGKDIFTLEGLKVFDDDTNKAVGCLADLAYGKGYPSVDSGAPKRK